MIVSIYISESAVRHVNLMADFMSLNIGNRSEGAASTSHFQLHKGNEIVLRPDKVAN